MAKATVSTRGWRVSRSEAGEMEGTEAGKEGERKGGREGGREGGA
jgi:hypothetical protein